MRESFQQKLELLTAALGRTVTGRCAIALAGAHAKGTADAASDIDLYVYAEDCAPYESAVRRGDILFTAPIVLHTVLDMVQVVFARNKTYFPGDKKLEPALAGLKDCPEALRRELDFLLCASRDLRDLERQRQLLRQAYRQLRTAAENMPAEDAAGNSIK